MTEDIQDLVTRLNSVPRLQDILPEERERIAAQIIPRLQPIPGPEERAEQIAADDIRQYGYTRIGRLLDEQTCARLSARLSAIDTFAAHVPAQSNGTRYDLKECRHHSGYGSYLISDVLAQPEIKALATSPRLHRIASHYLGCRASLYSVHSFWSFAGRGGLTQQWHRDIDDYHSVALFVYLTDVGPDDGPIAYQPGTHRIGATVPEEVDWFAMKAGYGVMLDPYGNHMGQHIRSKKDRLVLWIRYGLGKNRGYMIDKTEPVEVDHDVPWEFRLVMRKRG